MGPGIAGWLGGLPISAGPIALFLALEQGSAFAAEAALATIGSIAGTSIYCLAYVHAAKYGRWPLALLCAVASWTLASLGLLELARFTWFGLTAAIVLAIVAAALSLRLYPRWDNAAQTDSRHGHWDWVMRVFATWIVLFVVTLMATTLGPSWSGLFTTFPVVSTVLAIFAHRQVSTNPHAPRAVAALLRGIVSGLGSTIAFFVALVLLLPVSTIAFTFSMAVLAALAVQAGSYYWIRPGA